MKYILSILLLLTPVVACASWGVMSVKSAAVGCVCTPSLTEISLGPKATQGSIDNGLTNYQLLDNADTKTICKISWQLRGVDASSTGHLEIWDSSGSAQINGDSDVETVSQGVEQDIDFEWNDNTPPEVIGDYRIVLVEDSGGLENYLVGDGTNYSTTDYDYHAWGSDNNRDAIFTVNYCGGD